MQALFMILRGMSEETGEEEIKIQLLYSIISFLILKTSHSDEHT